MAPLPLTASNTMVMNMTGMETSIKGQPERESAATNFEDTPSTIPGWPFAIAYFVTSIAWVAIEEKLRVHLKRYIAGFKKKRAVVTALCYVGYWSVIFILWAISMLIAGGITTLLWIAIRGI